MCGVIGVHLDNVKQTDYDLVDRVFRQSMIRGKHATGVTFVKDRCLSTVKEPVSAEQFMDNWKVESFDDQGKLRLIGHIRYSTSDLRHNQPFQNNDVSIAHNGVISQDPDKWEFETTTKNDSELILRAIEAGENPLQYYADRSMAVVELRKDCIYAYRNHERPLWYALLENGIIFASTKDILYRSGIMNAQKCDPFVKYRYDGQLYETYYANDYEDLQC